MIKINKNDKGDVDIDVNIDLVQVFIFGASFFVLRRAFGGRR